MSNVLIQTILYPGVEGGDNGNAMQCSAVQCIKVYSSAVLYIAEHCFAVQYSSVQFSVSSVVLCMALHFGVVP